MLDVTVAAAVFPAGGVWLARRPYGAGDPFERRPGAPGDDRGGMFLGLDYYAGPARGAMPSWPNIMDELSWWEWLTFDGLAAADRVSTPALFTHSDGCVFPDTVRELALRVGGPVEVAWGGGTQTDFYDQPEQVGFAIEAVDRYQTATMPVDEEVRA